jgi:microcystin-dependent protein
VTDQFVAEIRIFGFNFAPTGWALCNGQLLPISQNTALFSLLGTMYGGNGQSTFALPDLQGRAPMHPGQGPGLSSHVTGEDAGSDTVTLLDSEIPAHTHTVTTSQADGTSQAAAGEKLASGIGIAQYATAANLTSMAFQSVGPTGADQPHNNLQPYLTLNFCIALQGIFPPRG